MESVWSREIVDSISVDSIDVPEEDIGITTFLWNAYCKKRHVDVEFGIKASDESESMQFLAHKFVLALWSPYFADRFYGPGHAMENLIVFENVNPNAFETMLKFMYGYHSLPKSVKDARELYKVALKFEVASLIERSENIVNRTTPDVSNVFDLIEVSDYMHNQNRKRQCLRLISEKTKEVLKLHTIPEISPSRLQLILDSHKLSLKCEYDLLQFVYAWGKNRFITTSKFSSVREALEDFLLYLNFLALSNRQFAEFHKNHPDFLTESEVISIFMNIADADSWPMPGWHSEQAERRIYTGTES